MFYRTCKMGNLRLRDNREKRTVCIIFAYID